MRLSFLACLFFTLSTQCSQNTLPVSTSAGGTQELIPQQRFYQSGALLANFTITPDSLMEGVYEEYYLDSTVHRRIHYHDGIIDGLYESFYPSGAIASRHHYLDGYTHGPYFWYHENGTLAQQGEKIWGKVEGEVKIYHPNGQLQSLSNYRQERLTGPEFMYYPDGSLQSFAYYDQDADQILTITYRENGEVAQVFGQAFADIQADLNRFSGQFTLDFNLAVPPDTQARIRLIRRQGERAWSCPLERNGLHYRFQEPLPDDFTGKYQLQLTFLMESDSIRFTEEIYVRDNAAYFGPPL
jgi:antitoxin component YwqK of YwqJK toxin-antitoxin module